MKISMSEIPKFCFGVAVETLRTRCCSKVRNLVETVHVELAYKGAEVTMFEPSAENFMQLHVRSARDLGLLLGWLINDSLLDSVVNDAHRRRNLWHRTNE
jgi:hypothetical protein